MKKSYKLENLDCANCAAKMETAINKLEDIHNCTISFMTQKLTIEADEDKFPEIIKIKKKSISKVERGCKIKI